MGVPEEGIDVVIRVNGGDPWSGLLVDHQPGLPERGEFLEAARNSQATSAHFGDDTLVSTTLSL